MILCKINFWKEKLLGEKVEEDQGRNTLITSEWTGKGYVECKRIVQNRDDWRKMITDLVKADGTF